MAKNRFEMRRGRPRIAGICVSVFVFVLIIVLFNTGINDLASANEQEALEAARAAVVRSVMTYYAIEGRFPTGIDYLEERYGLAVDRERFIINYRHHGANIMPQITVIPRYF